MKYCSLPNTIPSILFQTPVATTPTAPSPPAGSAAPAPSQDTSRTSGRGPRSAWTPGSQSRSTGDTATGDVSNKETDSLIDGDQSTRPRQDSSDPVCNRVNSCRSDEEEQQQLLNSGGRDSLTLDGGGMSSLLSSSYGGSRFSSKGGNTGEMFSVWWICSE